MVALEHIADGRAADGVAELAQLAMDPAVAPPPVLGGEPQDQGLEFGRQRWPPRRAGPRARPFPAHQVAMPPQDRLGLEQDQAAPERAASGAEPGELGRQDGQGELLPAREPWCPVLMAVDCTPNHQTTRQANFSRGGTLTV